MRRNEQTSGHKKVQATGVDMRALYLSMFPRQPLTPSEINKQLRLERPENLIFCPDSGCWYLRIKKVFVPWEEPEAPTCPEPEEGRMSQSDTAGPWSMYANTQELERKERQRRVLQHVQEKQRSKALSKHLRYLELIGATRPPVSWSRDSHPPIQTARHVTSRYRH